MAKLSKLRDSMLSSFSEAELRDLCFDLNVVYEDVPGNTRRDKTRELVAYQYRIANIPELLTICGSKRPRLDWQQFANIEPMKAIDLASPESTTLSPQQARLFLEILDVPANLNRNKYANVQVDIYRDIWKSLYSLQLAGDDLWEKASHENIMTFSQVLGSVRHNVEGNAIFLVEKDYEDLKRLLRLFGKFRLGKLRLYEIRNFDKDKISNYIPIQMARRQIQENKSHKEAYEVVLGSVKASFRSRLSGGS